MSPLLFPPKGGKDGEAWAIPAGDTNARLRKSGRRQVRERRGLQVGKKILGLICLFILELLNLPIPCVCKINREFLLILRQFKETLYTLSVKTMEKTS
jgi:hypothetical protein